MCVFSQGELWPAGTSWGLERANLYASGAAMKQDVMSLDVKTALLGGDRGHAAASFGRSGGDPRGREVGSDRSDVRSCLATDDSEGPQTVQKGAQTACS